MANYNEQQGLSFKIPQKNNSLPKAEAPILELVTYPFRFYRYCYLSKESKGQTVNVANIFFHWSNISMIPFDKSGFLYIYYEKKLTKDKYDLENGAEYMLKSRQSDNKEPAASTYAKIHPKSPDNLTEGDWDMADYTQFINFNEGDIVWIAYSEVRWSKHFRQRVLNDFEQVKKRFQRLDVSKFTTESDKSVQVLKDYPITNHYAIWEKESPEDSALNIIYGYAQIDGDKYYNFVTAAATLFVDDQCKIVKKENELFQDYIHKISTGIDPETNESCRDSEAYKSLFMSASVLYSVLLDMTDEKKSYSEDNSPIKKAQTYKLEKLLALSERDKMKENIYRLQDEVTLTMNSGWFKIALLEYIDNCGDNRLKGKETIFDYFQKIKHNPYNTDIHIFSFDSYNMSRKSEGFDLTKYDKIIEYSCKCFLFSDKEEEKKYKDIDTSVLTYDDINDNLDTIKLLLNLTITEAELFKHNPKGRSFESIYNALANIEKEDADAINLPADLNNLTSAAARALTFTDNILFYFCMYVTTSEQLHQLLNQVVTHKTLIEDLGLGLVKEKERVDKVLASLYENYDEVMAKLNGELTEAETELRRADAQKNPTSIRKSKKKDKRVEKAQKNRDSKVDEIAATQKEHGAKVKAAKEEHNSIALKYNQKLRTAKWEKGEIERIDIETYKRDTFKTVRKIQKSPLWENIIFSVSMAGVISSVYINYNETRKERSRIMANGLGLTSSIFQLLAVMGDKAVENGLIDWERIAKKLKLKNQNMTLGMRFGFASAIFQIGADLFYAYHAASRGNMNAASLYATSAASLAGATYIFWSISVATRTGATISAPAPYVAGALMVVSIITGIMAGYYDYNDMENFIADSVFGKGGLWTSKELDKTRFDTSFKVGMALYNNKEGYSEESYTGLGFTDANLQNFNEMFDIVRSLYVPFRCVFHGTDAEILKKRKGSDTQLMQYNQFRLYMLCADGIVNNGILEYEVRIYPYGVQGGKGGYFVLKLIPEKHIDKKGKEGILVRFVLNQSDIDTHKRGCDNPGKLPENPYLLALVRIRQEENRYNLEDEREFFPTLRNGEDCFFGFGFHIKCRYRNPRYFSMALKPDRLSNFLKN